MLLKPEEAQTKLCPLLNILCQEESCMGWQYEDLGSMGGIAEKGFCGMVNRIGRNKAQAPTPYY